jgi:hypothetical protein
LKCGTDDNGNLIEPDVDPITGYVEGLVTGPKDFEVKFTLRSERKREMIHKELRIAEKEVFSQYET